MQSHLSKDVVRNITTAMQLQSELQLAQAQHGVAVLDIYNSEWGHCKALGETFRRLYTDAGDVIYLRFFSVECNAVLESLRNDAAGGSEGGMASYYPGVTSHAGSSAAANKKMSMSGRASLKQPPNLSMLNPAATATLAATKAAATPLLNRQGVMSYHADTTPEVWSAILESRVKHAKPFFVVYKEGKICGQVEGIDTPRICKVVRNLCTPPEPASNFITNPTLLHFWENHFDVDESKVSSNELMHALMNDAEMQQVKSIADWLHVNQVNTNDSNMNGSDNNNNEDKPINVLCNAIIHSQNINNDNNTNDDESSDNIITAAALQTWIGDDSTFVEKLIELIEHTQQLRQTLEQEQEQEKQQEKEQEQEEEEEGEYEYEYEEEEEVKPEEKPEEEKSSTRITTKVVPAESNEEVHHEEEEKKQHQQPSEEQNLESEERKNLNQQQQEEQEEEEEGEYEYEEVTEEEELEEHRQQTQHDDANVSSLPNAEQNVNQYSINSNDNYTTTTTNQSNEDKVDTNVPAVDENETVPPDMELDNKGNDDGNNMLHDNIEGKQNVNQVLLEDRWVTVSAEEMRIWDCIASLPLQYPVSTLCAIRIESILESNNKSVINSQELTESINAEIATLHRTLTLLEYLQHESLSKDEVNMMCLAADQKVGSESLSLGKLALVLMSCQPPVTDVLLHNANTNIYSELCSNTLLHLHPSIALTALTLCASATESDECFYYCPSCDNSQTRPLSEECKVNDLMYLPALTPLYCDDPHTDQGGDGQQSSKADAIDDTINHKESNNATTNGATNEQPRSEMAVIIEGLPKVIELATTDPSVTNTVLLNQWHARLRVVNVHETYISAQFVEYICDQEYEKEVESFAAKLVEEEAQIDRKV